MSIVKTIIAVDFMIAELGQRSYIVVTFDLTFFNVTRYGYIKDFEERRKHAKDKCGCARKNDEVQSEQ